MYQIQCCVRLGRRRLSLRFACSAKRAEPSNHPRDDTGAAAQPDVIPGDHSSPREFFVRTCLDEKWGGFSKRIFVIFFLEGGFYQNNFWIFVIFWIVGIPCS